MKRLFCFCLLISFLIAGTAPAVGQTTADGPSVRANGFGKALEVQDDVVFVGEPDNIHTSGRVYLFTPGEQSEWAQKTVLKASDGGVGDGFGSAVDVRDSTLVVGAPASNAAYVFQRQDEDTWQEAARLSPSAADSASSFGQSVQLIGERLFVGAEASEQAQTQGAGVVYAYEREGDGWAESAAVSSGAVPQGSGFGSSVVGSGSHLLVSAPSYRSGIVVAFRWSEEEGWTEEQLIEAGGLNSGARLGTSLRWTEAGVIAGAPRAFDATGAVRSFRFQEEDSTWSEESALLPFDGTSRHFFGAALAHESNDLWIGAPGANGGAGALYRYKHDGDGWSGATRIKAPAATKRTQLGATVAAMESAVAVGLPGDDHGAGTMAVYSPSDAKWSTSQPLVPLKDDVLASMTGETQACGDGKLGDFTCEGIDLHAFLPISDIGGERGIELNDVWGWTDPETGAEYALVGRTNGTAFVDVSDPSNPVYVGELPLTDGARVNSWRDIKVYENHAYVVADNAGEHGMQIFDLTQLRDVDASERPVTFEETALYERVNSVHNIVINEETGYAYAVGSSGGGETCGGGLHMINIQDPTNPTFEGCFADSSTGRSGTGYSHDAQCVVYDGPDQEYQGREICIGYNETAISVADVTDKDNPKAIATASYPDHAYIHQGWFTEDQRYIYQNDELDELQNKVDRTRTLVWDMSDLDNPTLVNEVFLEPTTDHNLYVKGNTMYQSNYKSGLRVLDISNPTEPQEIAHFDTMPYGTDEPGFQGSWSNYPYFESGTIVVTGIGEGLFVVRQSEQEL